jgi:hypothetical protein
VSQTRFRTPLATHMLTPGSPRTHQLKSDPSLRKAATWMSRHSMLLTIVAGHQASLAMMALITVILLIGALLAIVLVSLARRDDRVDAIRAVAEVLRALLPWPSHRQAAKPDSRGKPQGH